MSDVSSSHQSIRKRTTTSPVKKKDEKKKTPSKAKNMDSPVADAEAKGETLSSPVGPPPAVPFFGSGPPRHKYFRLELIAWILFGFYIHYRMYSPLRQHSVGLHDHLQRNSNVVFGKPWYVLEKFFGATHVDHSDHQWREFFNHLPLLVLGMGLFVTISQVALTKGGVKAQAYARVLMGMGFLYYLHGVGAIFVVILLTLNYLLAQCYRFVPGRILMPFIWFAQIGLLFIIEHFKGSTQFENFLGSFGAWLDSTYTGSMRWYVIFNMNTLRMISFDYDLFEAATNGPSARQSALSKHQNCLDCVMHGEQCYKARSDIPAQMEDFHLVNYFAYTLYPPLFIAGPMGSFNAFVSNMYSPQRWITLKDWLKYVFAVVRLIIVMEVLGHFYHFNALRAEMEVPNSVFVSHMTVTDVASMGYYGLAFLWLKFSIFWKFFRAVAVVDGVEVPEDMWRCFSNVGTVAEFWQSWHSSFNIWIVRYMYIPMGGSKRKLLSVFPIFAFIALWHDIHFRLFFWAGLMCITMVVEAIVIQIFSGKAFNWMWAGDYCRFWRTFGRFGTCTSLVIANVVGFGGGGGNDNPMEWGNWAILICGPGIFTLGCAIGVISRENADWLRRRQEEYFGVKRR